MSEKITYNKIYFDEINSIIDFLNIRAVNEFTKINDKRKEYIDPNKQFGDLYQRIADIMDSLKNSNNDVKTVIDLSLIKTSESIDTENTKDLSRRLGEIDDEIVSHRKVYKQWKKQQQIRLDDFEPITEDIMDTTTIETLIETTEKTFKDNFEKDLDKLVIETFDTADNYGDYNYKGVITDYDRDVQDMIYDCKENIKIEQKNMRKLLKLNFNKQTQSVIKIYEMFINYLEEFYKEFRDKTEVGGNSFELLDKCKRETVLYTKRHKHLYSVGNPSYAVFGIATNLKKILDASLMERQLNLLDKNTEDKSKSFKKALPDMLINLTDTEKIEWLMSRVIQLEKEIKVEPIII